MSISIHLVYKASFKFNSIQFCLAWEVCMWIATRFFVGLIRSPSTQSNDHIHSINIPHHTKLYYILNITYTFHKHSLPYKTIPHTKHNISIPYHTKLFHIDPISLPHHTKLHHTIPQYASGIRRGRTQEESGPGWGHSVPSTGRQLRRLSQETCLIHQGSEGRSLSHLAIILIFLPGEIFLLLASGALCERWALCGSSTLPPYRSPGRGRPMTWGTSPSVLSWSSTRCSRPISCLGVGQDGKWRTGGRRLGPAGKSESSLERGLWGCAGADRNGHIPGKKWNPSR